MRAWHADRRVLLGQWGRKTLRPHRDGDGFFCVHCRRQVSADWLLSGVRNRNHCPYCLHSRHLDLMRPGDRLAACKGVMQPIGLTLKRVSKKYGMGQGELMLVHQCLECGKVSINRIAADDDGSMMLSIFEGSQQLDWPTRNELEAVGIRPLSTTDLGWVRAQLFGKN